MSGKTTLPLPALELLLGAAVFLADFIAIALTRVPNGIALLWPGCAIGACALIRLPRLRLGRAAITLFSAALLVNVVAAHRPWGVSAAFSLLNLAEVGLMVAAFRHLLVYPYPDLNVTQAAVMTAVLGIAIPAICAVAGAWLIAAVSPPSAACCCAHPMWPRAWAATNSPCCSTIARRSMPGASARSFLNP